MGWNGSRETERVRSVERKSSSSVLYVIVAVGLGLAVALLAYVFFTEPSSGPKRNRGGQPAQVSVSNANPMKDTVRSVGSGDLPEGKRQARPKRRIEVIDTYSPEDRKLADAVQAALDDDNFEQTRKAAEEAMKSENPEVRQEAVDALGWFGDKALIDLTKAMTDKNADVADSARSHVEDALMGMEDDDRAFVLASEYVKMFAEDEEAVTMFTGVLSSAGSRIIDPDDSDSAEDVSKAKGNRAGIVDIVDEMIGKGGKLEEKGRELYEEITGDEWTDRATADAWANDIEEPQQEEPAQEESKSEAAESSES